MESSAVLSVASQCAAAVSARDFGAVTRVFTEDIVWHQPGRNQLSGSHRGAAAIGETFGGMMTVIEGSFELRTTGDSTVNGSLVGTPVHSSARRNGEGDGDERRRPPEGRG
ncbi:nuclear transport factor 2 family protein [Streptomyces sp. NPDC020802]|uniref:nuclear transport factor 2 family protein n=1 Tax=Streptomyces sp. NPDC020802 TaxID=3365094 RepID=UPI003799F510